MPFPVGLPVTASVMQVRLHLCHLDLWFLPTPAETLTFGTLSVRAVEKEVCAACVSSEIPQLYAPSPICGCGM